MINPNDLEAASIYQDLLITSSLNALFALHQIRNKKEQQEPQMLVDTTNCTVLQQQGGEPMLLSNNTTPMVNDVEKPNFITCSPKSSKRKTKRIVVRQHINPRQELLVQIKILFLTMNDSVNNNNLLRTRARGIVLQCTGRHRMGDPQYQNLSAALIRDLPPCVGQARWKMAQRQAIGYCHRRQRMMMMTSSSML